MKNFCFGILLLSLIGCQEIQRPEKPADLIPEDKMISLLSEIYIGNAARNINNKHIRDKGIKLDSFLFAKYDVDRWQFADSNEYYAANLDTYKGMFEQITTQLEKFKKEENDKKLAQDSIRQANMKDTLSNKRSVKQIGTIQSEGLLSTPIETDTIE